MRRQAEPYDDIVDRAYLSGALSGALLASAAWVIVLAVFAHWLWKVL